MTSTKISPLRLEAPRLVADMALSQHLAALARASAPSGTSRVRRSGWRVPLAAVATIAATGGVAYAGQVALEGKKAPQPAAVATIAVAQAFGTSMNSLVAQAVAGFQPITVHVNPGGTVVGRNHPKTGTAKGHPGRDDAGKHPREPKPERLSLPLRPPFDLWRKSVGSAGVSRPW